MELTGLRPMRDYCMPMLVYTPTSKEFVASDFKIHGTIPDPVVMTKPKLL
jgi:hypothetical protein